MAELTPMMQQYVKTKEENKDCILFYRLGDFYEMFFDDAITASKVLEITLTKRNAGAGNEKAPLCGVPHHSLEGYLAKMVENGYKVAICEQVEDPATAKGIVKREVIQVVTPGTLTNGSMLKEQENNYLASIWESEAGIGLSYCDISTGELNGVYITGKNTITTLINELVRIGAKEVLLSREEEDSALEEQITDSTGSYINFINDKSYDEESGKRMLFSQFSVNSLKGLGLDETFPLSKSLFGLFSYLRETQKQTLGHINKLNIYDLNSHMSLDRSSIRNLELTETLYEKDVKGSLLGILDKTHTAMGSRTMKKWLREPLISTSAINKRLDAVEILTDEMLIRNHIKEHLKRVYDLERLAGRLSYGNANGKDLIALKNSVAVLPELKDELSSMADITKIREINDSICVFSDIFDSVEKAIVEDPPFMIKEGGLIKEGYDEDLDNLKDSIKDGQQWIASLENSERERTGIKNLKVRFNKVFGYYIDVTKSNLDMIPENYVRKQTLVNSERYITPELKEVESTVLNAETKINQMEYEIFTKLREYLTDFIEDLQKTSLAIAELDVLTSYAEVGSKLGYVKPVINDGEKIQIEKGRHPVIEQTMKDSVFVPNDIYMDKTDNSMLLITGPNMAGKSTYMRQTALIVLMAQTGCFVPAERAEIGVTDRIYTRIGASDNLAHGESTFYVEMSELAYILNTATENSLIILDEIGRGTSTYDGLSIAWAVVEHLTSANSKIRTMFATHYQELTVLEDNLPGFRNLNVDVSDDKGEVVFLHKIVEGSASRSYGIHVARLAGVPGQLLENAQVKLSQLEEEKQEVTVHVKHESANRLNHSENRSDHNESQYAKWEAAQQLSFFEFAPNPIVEELKALDLMEVKPSEAIGILERLKEAAEKD